MLEYHYRRIRVSKKCPEGSRFGKGFGGPLVHVPPLPPNSRVGLPKFGAMSARNVISTLAIYVAIDTEERNTNNASRLFVSKLFLCES